MSHIEHIRCVLAVTDLAKSAGFYRDNLGFKVDFEVDGWAFLSRDRFSVMLGHCPDEVPAKQTGNHSWFAYANVDGVDALYLEYRQKGVNIIEPVEDKPWGMREFAIETPDGHRIKFGQSCSGDQGT